MRGDILRMERSLFEKANHIKWNDMHAHNNKLFYRIGLRFEGDVQYSIDVNIGS